MAMQRAGDNRLETCESKGLSDWYCDGSMARDESDL